MPAPLDPPSHFPVRDLSRSPNHKDAFYWELISRESVEFQDNTPIKRGTPYATILGAKQSVIDAYPNGLWFCEEIVPLRSSEVGGMPGHQFVIWLWSTDRAAQSQTNANITYSSESITHPIYARERIVRRDAYEADPTDAVASSLTALIGVTITNAGSGYTYATGTVGTATVEFVVSAAGTLIAGIVTNEGSGIGSGAAITITGDGAAATATAVIQPATAILVHQEKRELPQDSNLSHEFVQVLMVYETLPGPSVTSYQLIGGTTLRKIVRQKVAATTQPTDTGTNVLSDTVKAADTVVAERETVLAVKVSDGTATYFENTTTTRVDKPPCTIYTTRRWPVSDASTQVTVSGATSPVVNGVWKESGYFNGQVLYLFTLSSVTYALWYAGSVPMGWIISNISDLGNTTTIANFWQLADTANPIGTPYVGVGTFTGNVTVASGAVTLPAIDDAFNGGFVIAARKIPIDDGPHYIHEIDWMLTVPTTYVEYVDDGYSFPGMFTLTLLGLEGYDNETESHYRFRYPIPGVHFNYTKSRRGRFPMRVTRSFQRTTAPALVATDIVTTPGTGSRVFSIPENTCHPALHFHETGTDGYAERTAEDIAASTPATYTPGDILTVACPVTIWKGLVYMKTLIEVDETGAYGP